MEVYDVVVKVTADNANDEQIKQVVADALKDIPAAQVEVRFVSKRVPLE